MEWLRRAYPQAGRFVRSWMRRRFTASARSATTAITRRGWRGVGQKIGLGAALLVVTTAGIAAGLTAGGHETSAVGPFQAQLSISLSWAGGTDVQIPPLGSLHLDSHHGPARLGVRLDNLDQQRVLALAADPHGIDNASQTAATDLKTGVTRLVWQAAAASFAGVIVLSALVFRSVRRVSYCAGLAVVALAGTAAVTFGTFRADSIEQPTYTGLLANAPAVIGDAQRISDQFGQYQQQLQRMVTNVGRLYNTFSTLPVYQPTPGTIRVLHVSDLHLNPAAWSVIQTVVTQYRIDVVIDTGDINDWGTTVEANTVNPIGFLGVPYVFVRGNHDSAATAAAVAAQPHAIVLDNTTTTVAGLTIAGVGDPRFTPDKTAAGSLGFTAEQTASLLDATASALADTIRSSQTPVDIALIHDPAAAGPLNGTVPLILAGHLHARRISTMPALPDRPPTAVMVEGSTGGAGLRGLEGEKPTPLEMSVLYFGSDRILQAYDNITIGGAGTAKVTIDRHIAQPDRAETIANPTIAPLPTTTSSAAAPMPTVSVPTPASTSSARP